MALCQVGPRAATVARVSQSVVRSPLDTTRAWRMRAWPGDDSVAHLIFLDHNQVPTTNDIAAAVDHATRKGARAIRTSALFPDSAKVLLSAGFAPIDRLALLRLALDDTNRALPTTTDIDGRIGPMRPWHLTPSAQVDRESFGLMWGNTPASLRDIRRATPSHHCRVVRQRGHVVGFAISGAAADIGYIQRLAVATETRRTGIARALVVEALQWMDRRGVRQALVNTGVANDPALKLYDSIGFTRLADELAIAELKLT